MPWRWKTLSSSRPVASMPATRPFIRSSPRRSSGIAASARSRLSFTLSMSRAKPVAAYCAAVDLLLLQPAADVLGLGLGVEDVLAHLLQLLFELAAAGRAFISPAEVDLAVLDLSSSSSFFVHPINLDNAFAVKSTMGTTRA